jgi:hypothetical protein
MPRTGLPTIVLTTPDYVNVSFRYIDSNGVKDSFSIRTTVARATAAAIEGVVAAVAAASNAFLYKVEVQSVFQAGTASPSNALDAIKPNAKDVIERLQTDPASGKSQYGYIPAPLDAIFIPTTNEVDIENSLYTDFEEAIDLLLPAAYNPVSVRFAEHKLTAPKTTL